MVFRVAILDRYVQFSYDQTICLLIVFFFNRVAIQTHQMWSHRHNVNLLVAGANLPSAAITGSGIYSGELGNLAFEFSNTPLTRLLVDDIPRNPGTFDSYEAAAEKRELAVNVKSVDSHILPGLALWREHLNNFNTRFLNISAASEFKDRICISNDNNVCCDYDIAVTLSKFPAGSVCSMNSKS